MNYARLKNIDLLKKLPVMLEDHCRYYRKISVLNNGLYCISYHSTDGKFQKHVVYGHTFREALITTLEELEMSRMESKDSADPNRPGIPRSA